MTDTKFSAYEDLSIGEVGSRMCKIKEEGRLDRVEEPQVTYVELDGNFIPVGLGDPYKIVYLGRNGEYGSMTSDEAADILKKDHELRIKKDLEAKGITRQDVEGFLEYIVLSATLEKKLHPELYETQ